MHTRLGPSLVARGWVAVHDGESSTPDTLVNLAQVVSIRPSTKGSGSDLHLIDGTVLTDRYFEGTGNDGYDIIGHWIDVLRWSFGGEFDAVGRPVPH